MKMGKKRRGGTSSAPIHRLKGVDVSNGNEYADKVDSSAADFIYDEVDQHYADEERQGMEKVHKLLKKPKATYRVNKYAWN